MQKEMTRAIGVFTLVLFVLSVIGAAAASTPCKANPDALNLIPSKYYVGNVLSNDQGDGLKVVSASKTTNGGKAIVYSQGDFYYKPASGSRTTTQDSFTYTIVDKYGHKSTAKVTINYKKPQGSTDTGNVVEVTQLDQINAALNKGPVFLELGVELCQYCQEMKPIMQEMATEYQGRATIMSADVDQSPKLADYFGVESMPHSCIIVGINNGQYIYMKQNGDDTTDKSQAAIIGLYDKGTFEKVVNLALKK